MVILEVWNDKGEMSEFTFLSRRDAEQAQQVLIWVTRGSDLKPTYYSVIR